MAMKNNDHWTLLSRCLAGEASPEEEEQVKQLMAGSPIFAEEYRLLKLFWQQRTSNDPEAAELAYQKVWEKIQAS